MATDTASEFGEVSRRVGIAFRYLLLASTLVGIVTLGFLLLYVFNDAIQPLSADPGWHLTFLLTLVLPGLATGWWCLQRGYATFTTGLVGFFLPVLASLYSGAIAALFIDVIPTLVWLAFVVAFAVPVGVFAVLQRPTVDLPFLANVALVGGSAIGSLLVLPGLIQGLPTVPSGWVVLLMTLGLPAGLLLVPQPGWPLGATRGSDRRHRCLPGCWRRWPAGDRDWLRGDSGSCAHALCWRPDGAFTSLSW
jgi:hypothetical protein